MLFDHLVGTYKDCFGKGNPEGLRGLEVHDHLEPRRALNRQVDRSGAAQNPSDVTATTAKHIGKVRPIGNQAAGVRMRPVKVDRRQASFHGEFSDPRSVSEIERIRQNDARVGPPVLRRVESAVYVRGVLQFQTVSLKRERASDPRQLTKLWCIDVGISEYGDARRSRYNLLEQLQVLSAQLGKIEKHSSDIASRPRDARYQSRLNRIDFEIYPCDRDCACRVFGGCQSPGAANHIDFKFCEFRCELGKKFGLAVSGTMFEFDVLSLRVTGLA